MDEFSDFTNLPPEIQNDILSRKTTNMGQIARLSKSIQDLMKPDFCETPITIQEFEQYVQDENPKIFGVFRIYNHNPTSFMITPNVDDYMVMSKYQYHVGSLINSDVSFTEFNFGINVYDSNQSESNESETRLPEEYYFANYTNPDSLLFVPYNPFRPINWDMTPGLSFKLEFDLLTTYRILMRRISCLSLKPDSNFAKDTVKQWFIERVNRYTDYINKQPGFILDLFLYLRTQMLILNIHIPEVNQFQGTQFGVYSPSETEIDPDFKYLDEELIPLMVKSIHTRINIIELL